MSESECVCCRRPKATLTCEICQDALCKSCAQFLDAATFAFLETKPEELTHSHYCPTCYGAHVEPALEKYNEVLGRAREAYFFFTSQRKPIPILKKAKEGIQVASCMDRDETILRLGFLAASQGYNAVIEAEVTSEKVRNEGYQKSVWKGKGIPANVDVAKLERHLFHG